MNPKLLILDEPTRGIDVGAKAEIQALIRELAEQGLGVLMISSELEELVEGSDRVFVLRDGRTVAELRRGADRRACGDERHGPWLRRRAAASVHRRYGTASRYGALCARC